MSVGDRLYRLLLRWLPRSLRRQFGADMVQLFRDRRRETRGPLAGVRLWLGALIDVVREGNRARREERRPADESGAGSALLEFGRELRHSARTLARNPVLTTVALLSLALGIGVNSAVFSLVNAVFLRPLPYAGDGELVSLRMEIETVAGERESYEVWSYPYWAAFDEHVDRGILSASAIYVDVAMSLQGADGADRVHVEIVSDGYLELLGAGAARGRLFTPAESAPGAAVPVAVISSGAWRRLFGGAPDIVGRRVRLDTHELQIVGVAEPGFDGLSSEVDFWLPMGMIGTMLYPEALQEEHAYWMQVTGRLAPGVRAAETAPALRPLGGVLLERVPAESYARVTPVAMPMRDALIDPAIRQPLGLALGAVGFVLLIACGNVANLLLSRAVDRRREIATRIALGAGRARVLRQLLADGLVLGLAGAAVGLAFAALGMEALRPLLPDAVGWSRYARVAEAAVVDVRVLGFTTVLGLAAAVLFSLVPARAAMGSDLRASLAAGGRVQGRSTGRSLLVVAQLGLAVVLLVGAGLMVRTLANLVAVDTRATADDVLLTRFQLPPGKYRPASEFYVPLLERVRSLPEVRSAALATAAPLSGLAARTIAVLESEAATPDDFDRGREIGLHVGSEGYLATIGAELLRGRDLTAGDGPSTVPVALVNAAAARAFWPGEPALGKRIAVGMWAADRGWIEVVGVVDDVRYEGPASVVEPQVYLSYRQVPRTSIYLVVGATSAPAALVPRLRGLAAEVDPQVPMYGMQQLAEIERAATAHSRFLTVLLVVLAAVALVLAATGIQGLMAMTVAARRREIGIRMALGADRSRIVASVVGRAFGLAALGGATGLLAALALGRTLQGQLFGVTPADPLALGGTAALLAALAAAAALVPARRASRTDPVLTLRED